jgi:hypothetical protein
MVSGPHLGDDTGALLQDLVMCGAGIGVPGSAAPAPGSSSAAGPGVSGLLLLGSPSFPPPPIDWRRVGDEAKFPCSQVIVVDSCCTRRWRQSIGISCVRFGLV